MVAYSFSMILLSTKFMAFYITSSIFVYEFLTAELGDADHGVPLQRHWHHLWPCWLHEIFELWDGKFKLPSDRHVACGASLVPRRSSVWRFDLCDPNMWIVLTKSVCSNCKMLALMTTEMIWFRPNCTQVGNFSFLYMVETNQPLMNETDTGCYDNKVRM